MNSGLAKHDNAELNGLEPKLFVFCSFDQEGMNQNGVLRSWEFFTMLDDGMKVSDWDECTCTFAVSMIATRGFPTGGMNLLQYFTTLKKRA